MPTSSLEQHTQSARYFNIDGFKLAYWQHQPDSAVDHRSDHTSDHTSGHASDHTSEKAAPQQTIVFIHGFPSASWDWHHQWQALKHRAGTSYQLIALDMLGFGLSAKPYPHQYQLVDQARYIKALLARLQVTQCHLLAHDYGDSVAQELLHLAETGQTEFAIQSLTYLNGGLFSESHRPLLTQKLLLSPLGNWLVKLLNKRSLANSFHKIFGPDTPPAQHDIDTLWQLLQHQQGTRAMPGLIRYIPERAKRRADWLRAMQTTQTPQLFINGAHDPISGEHMRQRFTTLVPQGKTVSLPVGHYPQIEAPEAVLQHFCEFITDVAASND